MSLVFLRCVLLARHSAQAGGPRQLGMGGMHAMGLLPGAWHGSALSWVRSSHGLGGFSRAKLCRDMFKSEHLE